MILDAGLGGQSAPPSLKLELGSVVFLVLWSRGAVRPPFIEAHCDPTASHYLKLSRGAVRPPFIEAKAVEHILRW